MAIERPEGSSRNDTSYEPLIEPKNEFGKNSVRFLKDDFDCFPIDPLFHHENSLKSPDINPPRLHSNIGSEKNAESALRNFVKFRSDGPPNLSAVYDLIDRVYLEMRKNNREQRVIEMRNQVELAKQAARESLAAARERFNGALAGGVINIVGATASIGVGVRGVKYLRESNEQQRIADANGRLASSKDHYSKVASALPKADRRSQYIDAKNRYESSERSVRERRLELTRLEGALHPNAANIQTARLNVKKSESQLSKAQEQLKIARSKNIDPDIGHMESERARLDADTAANRAREASATASPLHGYTIALNSIFAGVAQTTSGSYDVSAAQFSEGAAKLQAIEKERAVAEDISRDSAQNFTSALDKVQNILATMSTSSIEAQKHAI